MDAVMLLAAPRWGHMGDNGWTNGMWIWVPLILLGWLVLAVVVTWLAVRSANNRTGAVPTSRPGPEPARTGVEQARDILAERYAKGEISSDEYAERLAGLAGLQ